MLDPKLLEILCCPVCKGDLAYDSVKNTLTCKQCNNVYHVRNDIPIMLIEEAGEGDC